MEIKINKDIQEYKETIAFGLDARQCVFSVLAAACAVLVYLSLYQIINRSIAGWIAIFSAVPAVLFGFFKVNEMTFERFIIAFVKSNFLFPPKRTFCTPEMREKIRAEQKAKRKQKPAKKKKETDEE